MPAREREELAYLREFARAARHECGEQDWPSIEALLRSVWAKPDRYLSLDAAIKVVKGCMGLPE